MTECASDARCAGDVAINCGPDDNGCLVEQSRQTCTGNTECSVSGDTASCVDPCAGIAQCDPDAFPACEGNLAVRCLANADGCFVRSTSNCAAISQVCSEGACEIPCGNGRLDSGETCDDGARRAGDGCSTTCRIEAGYTCTGTPSVCTLLPVTGCGNGVIDADEFEGCDDGNTAAGDGCSPTCAIEVPTNTTTVRTITGALASTDPTFAAPSSGCAARSSNNYYRAYRIENTTAAAITVNLLAEYDADGYLYIFDEDFDPAIPLDSCLLGDDDFVFNGQPFTRGSLIAGHTIPRTHGADRRGIHVQLWRDPQQLHRHDASTELWRPAPNPRRGDVRRREPCERRRMLRHLHHGARLRLRRRRPHDLCRAAVWRRQDRCV